MQTNGAMPASNVFRLARIESIRRALSDGSYRIDSAAIADRLLDEARSMIRARERQR